MNVYVPRFVLAAQVKAIRIALNEAGHVVDYIGHHPTDEGQEGPQIVNDGTPGPKTDKGAGKAWDLVSTWLDLPPRGYRVTEEHDGRWRWDAVRARIYDKGYPSFRQAVAAAWAHKGLGEHRQWQCRPEVTGRYEPPWEDLPPNEQPLWLPGVQYREKP